MCYPLHHGTKFRSKVSEVRRYRECSRSFVRMRGVRREMSHLTTNKSKKFRA
ncbi:hypothetical protein [Rubritalea tangerina]|uniref:hypothetical protein n=1 Tax=Rubritalea tangerina TaxID=430798 RepID=UPI00360CC525